MKQPKKQHLSCYENLNANDLAEVVRFGFTQPGFIKFKAALKAAKDRTCQ